MKSLYMSVYNLQISDVVQMFIQYEKFISERTMQCQLFATIIKNVR